MYLPDVPVPMIVYDSFLSSQRFFFRLSCYRYLSFIWEAQVSVTHMQQLQPSELATQRPGADGCSL